MIAFTDGVVVDAKVPLRQAMHTRSDVVVDMAEKNVPCEEKGVRGEAGAQVW